MCGRIGGLVAPLPPGEQQPRNDHDQADLQHQAEQRGEAAHAAEESVAKQQAEQSGAEEATGKTAEQTAAKQTWTRRSLANGAGTPGLRERALHRRGRVRRGLRGGRRRECAHPAAAAGEAATRARMRIGGHKHKRRCQSRQWLTRKRWRVMGFPRQIQGQRVCMRQGDL